MKILSALSLAISAVALVVALLVQRPVPAVSSLMSVQSELEAVRERLRKSEAVLAVVTERLSKLATSNAERLSQIPPRTAQDAATSAPPILVEGSYAVEQGAVVYDPNARLRVGKNLEVSSPSGVMVSNIEQKMIVGDLEVASPAGMMRAVGAAIDVPNQTMTAKQITFTPNQPNKAPEPTPGAVTPRATEGAPK